MNRQQRRARRRGPDSSIDENAPHLAVLLETQPGGAMQVHAGLARHGKGTTMCDLGDPVWPAIPQWLPEMPLAKKDPNFALYRTAGFRHRYAEAFLELNRGCKHCLHVLYEVGREAGYATPKGLT